MDGRVVSEVATFLFHMGVIHTPHPSVQSTLPRMAHL